MAENEPRRKGQFLVIKTSGRKEEVSNLARKSYNLTLNVACPAE